MSEELSSLVQVLELYGRGLGYLGKALKFTSKAAKSGVDLVKLKDMQRKMKLHYASQGTHNTMKVSDLEKLTGGNYRILNIPLEDEKDLVAFYDRLKKLKVSFAELPDLCIGDGFTQIAYDPQDAERVKTVVDYYKKNYAKESKEITLEDYEKLGGEEGKKVLDDLATKGFEAERCTEQIASIQEKNHSKDYTAIGLNIESIMMNEYKDRYYFRVPGTDVTQAICVKKDDVLIIDEGKTIFTHLKNQGKIQVYDILDKNSIDFDNPHYVEVDKVLSHFEEVKDAQLSQVNHIKVTETEKLPNFNKGRENISSVRPEEKMATIIQLEEIKAKRNNENYMPIELDVTETLVGEEETRYITKLPNSENGNYHCLLIEKTDAIISEDGSILQAYLEKGKNSFVREIDKDGNLIKNYKVKNETIISNYLVKKNISSEKKLAKKLQPSQKKTNVKVAKTMAKINK